MKLRVLLLLAVLSSLLGELAAKPEAAKLPQVDFQELSGYTLLEEQVDPLQKLEGSDLPNFDALIPQPLWRWNGQRVTVRGFMMPIRYEGTQVTEFMLFSNQAACCFGVVPKLNDWVNVKCPTGVPAYLDRLVEVQGRFSVGTRHEEGFITGIYHLDLTPQDRVELLPWVPYPESSPYPVAPPRP